MSDTQLLEKFFQKIEIKEIQKRIDDFNSNKKTLTDQELVGALKNLLLYTIPNTGGIRASVLTSFSQTYQVGAQFFRARKLSETMDINTFEVKDFWEPPPEVVGLGRFNRSLESYLYLTSGEFFTPKKELGITKKGERYLLIYYKRPLHEVSFSKLI